MLQFCFQGFILGCTNGHQIGGRIKQIRKESVKLETSLASYLDECLLLLTDGLMKPTNETHLDKMLCRILFNEIIERLET